MIVALNCIGLLTVSDALTPFDVAVLLTSIPGFLGVFAYAYARRILRVGVWRIWAWLQPLADAAATIASSLGFGAFASPEGESMLAWGSGLGIGVALSVPQYVALFRYGYRSQALWERPGS